MLIALSGSHGTGKSSLCKAYTEKHPSTLFHPTIASQVFKELGIDPGAQLDVETRLKAQEEILRAFNAAYESLALYQGVALVDRSPVDMIAYTYAQIDQSSVTDALRERFDAYVRDCYASLDRYFTTVVVLPPVLPVEVNREGKASSNRAYIDKVNYLIKGICCESGKLWHSIEPWETDMDDRIAHLERIVSIHANIWASVVESHLEEGGVLH